MRPIYFSASISIPWWKHKRKPLFHHEPANVLRSGLTMSQPSSHIHVGPLHIGIVWRESDEAKAKRLVEAESR